MKAYIRVDPLIDERKADYTPAQLGAYLKVLALGMRQTRRGRFKSMRHLIGAMPATYARLVPFLVEQRDLIETSAGVIEIIGWDDWQEGDLTVNERMARMRNRRRNDDRNGPSHSDSGSHPPPAPPYNPPLTPTSQGVSQGGSAVTDDEAREQLDNLRRAMEAAGIPPSKANGKPHPIPSETEPEYVARLQRIAADIDEVPWKRQAAKDQLQAMRVQP